MNHERIHVIIVVVFTRVQTIVNKAVVAVKRDRHSQDGEVVHKQTIQIKQRKDQCSEQVQIHEEVFQMAQVLFVVDVVAVVVHQDLAPVTVSVLFNLKYKVDASLSF